MPTTSCRVRSPITRRSTTTVTTTNNTQRRAPTSSSSPQVNTSRSPTSASRLGGHASSTARARRTPPTHHLARQLGSRGDAHQKDVANGNQDKASVVEENNSLAAAVAAIIGCDPDLDQESSSRQGHHQGPRRSRRSGAECTSSCHITNEEEDPVAETRTGSTEADRRPTPRAPLVEAKDEEEEAAAAAAAAAGSAVPCADEEVHRWRSHSHTKIGSTPGITTTTTTTTTTRTEKRAQDDGSLAKDDTAACSLAVLSPRPSYATVVTKRLPRSRTGAQYVNGACCTSHPQLFIDIPAHSPLSTMCSPTSAAGSAGLAPAGVVCGGTHDGCCGGETSCALTAESAGPSMVVRPAAPSAMAKQCLAPPCHGATTTAPATTTTMTTCTSAVHHLPARGPFGAVEVIPGLFLGANADAMHPETLREHNVSLVLNVAAECAVSAELAKNAYGVRYLHLPLKDHSDEVIAPYFVPMAQIIHAQLHRRALWQQQVQMGEDRLAEATARNAEAGLGEEEKEEQDVEAEQVLLSASAVSGHPFSKETRRETSRSPTPSSYMASPTSAGSTVKNTTTTTTTTAPAGRVTSPLSGRRNRFSPTFPAGAEVSTNDAVAAQETAAVLQQLVPPSSATVSAPASVRATSFATGSAERDHAGLLCEDTCGGLLIHCRMGVSRSASFILAYLMLFGKELASLPLDGAAVQWLFRPGWAEEERQLLARVFADQGRESTSENGAGMGGSALTGKILRSPPSRFARGGSGGSGGGVGGGGGGGGGGRSRTSKDSDTTRNNATTNTVHNSRGADASGDSTASKSLGHPHAQAAAQLWFSPMSPMSPQMQWRLAHSPQRSEPNGRFSAGGSGSGGGARGHGPSSGFGSPSALTSPCDAAAAAASSMNAVDTATEARADGEDCGLGATGLMGPHAATPPADAMTPLNQTILTLGATTTTPTTTESTPAFSKDDDSSSSARPLGPRQIAMGFCEACYRLRLAASVAAPSAIGGQQRRRPSGGSRQPTSASRVVSAATPIARTPATPTPTTVTTTTTTRFPALDGATRAGQDRAIPWRPSEPLVHAHSVSGFGSPTNGPTPVGIRSVGSSRLSTPCMPRPVQGATTTTTTTTTTMMTTTTGMAHKDRPQLQLETFSLSKAPPSFSSPTSMVSASLTSMNSSPALIGSGLSYSEAFHFLKSRKSNVNPNIGFVLALRELAGGEDDFSMVSSSVRDF